MFLKCAAMVQLLSNKYVSWVLYVKSQTETLSGETFALLKTVCYQCLNFVLRVTYCFITSCLLAHNQLSWNVLLIYYDLIGQLCLSGPNITVVTL